MAIKGSPVCKDPQLLAPEIKRLSKGGGLSKITPIFGELF
jgi:hypothetical protein